MSEQATRETVWSPWSLVLTCDSTLVQISNKLENLAWKNDNEKHGPMKVECEIKDATGRILYVSALHQCYLYHSPLMPFAGILLWTITTSGPYTHEDCFNHLASFPYNHNFTHC